MSEALLISSSFNHGKGYLEHAQEVIAEFLGSAGKRRNILFCPWAAHESKYDEYSSTARKFFEFLGFGFTSLSDIVDTQDIYNGQDEVVRMALQDPSAVAIFVGGGNTFRLLENLRKTGAGGEIALAVEQGGLKYIGASAGTVVACPTIKTTNDMPIVFPRQYDEDTDFFALDICPIQVNPHFVSGSLAQGHMGETREQRILEYHQENSNAVLGLPEQSWLLLNDEWLTLQGGADGTLFREGKHPEFWSVGEQKSVDYFFDFRSQL